jgi:predicted secreted protein
MAITTIIAIYFILWWVVLFTVLPWGVRSQHESGEPMAPGTDPGAPVRHRISRTLLWTTIITSVLVVVLWLVYTAGLLPVDVLMTIAGPPRQY